MKKEFFTYREKNMVIPPLDLIAYPRKHMNLVDAPPCIFSQWAINAKPSGNLDKKAVAGNAIKAGFNLVGDVVAFGAGVSTGGSGAVKAAKNISSIGNAINGSNMLALESCVKTFRQAEETNWNVLYLLYTFEPAQGKIGNLYKGISDESGYVGYCFDNNGDYFEGYFHNDGSRFGFFIFSNGDRMYGKMYKGIKFDFCYYLSADGSRMYGNFEENELVYGAICNNNCAFFGDWKNGQLHGDGWARYVDNSCFVGQWNHGNPVQ